jgi:flagellin-like protein
MRKIFKNAKALSPVVAAIILIAVTVAVSIAVAAWMGALTFTFMSKANPTVIGHTWDMTAVPPTLTLRVKNAGTSDLTWDYVEVNNVPLSTEATFAPTLLKPGEGGTCVITYNFVSGTASTIKIYTKTGETATYPATAP